MWRLLRRWWYYGPTFAAFLQVGLLALMVPYSFQQPLMQALPWKGICHHIITIAHELVPPGFGASP